MKHSLKLIFTGLLLNLPITSGVVFAESARCEATPQSFLGNSYVADVATYKKDVGKGLIMYGKVLSAKDCSPLTNAVIERWQAGDKGVYTDQLRALMQPEADGSYRFETEWPDMSIPHIHFIVTAKGFETLTTQWIPEARVSEAQFDLVLTPK